LPVIDISAPLRPDLPAWPGEEGLVRELTADQREGDPATVSHLSLGAHTGTHVDAPVHFIESGRGLEAFPLQAYVGPAYVADLTHVTGAISDDDLTRAGVPDATERLLLRTRNSGWTSRDEGFREDYAALDDPAADWCVARRLRLVGIDYLSIEPFDPGERGAPVHRKLLSASIVIVEGLELDGVDPGTYGLAALPLRIPNGADGAPARAVLTR
jgi:arylformamidase